MALGGTANVGPVDEVLRDDPTRPQKAALDLGYVLSLFSVTDTCYQAEFHDP